MDSIAEQARHWAKRLGDPAMGDRGQASHEVGQQGPAFIPVLIEILTGKNEFGVSFSHQSRRGAVCALCNMAAAAVPALATLITLLQDQDGTIRVEAASSLGAIGREAQPAVPYLVENMLSTNPLDPNEPSQAAWALGRIGGDGAVQGLIRALSNETDATHWHCRVVAAAALGELGHAARSAVPALIEKLRDRHEALREKAAAALKRIDPIAAEKAGVR